MFARIPDWLIGTKRVGPNNCVKIYDEKLGRKLGINYVSYEELRKLMKEHGVNSEAKYKKFRKGNWPSSPARFYKEEWISWPHLFGKEKIKYLSYVDLRKEVKKYKLKNREEYKSNRKPNWPSTPNIFYKKEWSGWSHLLGTIIEYLSYDELRKDVKKYGVDSQGKYRNKENRKSNWPGSPDSFYEEWVSWPHLFGREEKDFLSIKELKKEVFICGIKSKEQYLANRKHNWPSSPKLIYSDWKGWADLFGRKTSEFLSYEELVKDVKKHRIDSQTDYRKKRKIITSWPASPDLYYEEWVNWPCLFGREKVKYLTYEELQREVKKYKLKSRDEYNSKRRPNWPSTPSQFYKKDWTNWHGLFGK
jgi:glutaredoxin-related protein